MRHALLGAASAAFDGRVAYLRPESVLSTYSTLLEAARFEPRGEGGKIGGLISRFLPGVAPAKPSLAIRSELAVGGMAMATSYGFRLGQVAVITIDGPLMQYAWIVDWGDGPCCLVDGYDRITSAVRSAAADQGVRAILLDVRSGGGQVAGCHEAADAIFALRGDKPIWAHVNDMSCSAAYELTAQADRVIAAESSITGNVGAIRMHYSWADYLAKEGIKPTFVQKGALKSGMHPDKDLEPAAQALMQSEVDHATGLLFDRIARARPVTAAELEGLEAAWFSTPEALSNKLIDAVQSFEATLAELGVQASATPIPGAASAADQETEMKRSELQAAMTAAGLSAEQIAAVEAKLPADQADPPAGQPPAIVKAAVITDPAAPAEATAPDGPTVLAILALPEAKGREPLAQMLAAEPGMTEAKAKTWLTAAPKTSSLEQRMEGRDPKLSASGGEGQEQTADDKTASFMLTAHAELTGAPKRQVA